RGMAAQGWGLRSPRSWCGRTAARSRFSTFRKVPYFASKYRIVARARATKPLCSEAPASLSVHAEVRYTEQSAERCRDDCGPTDAAFRLGSSARCSTSGCRSAESNGQICDCGSELVSLVCRLWGSRFICIFSSLEAKECRTRSFFVAK